VSSRGAVAVPHETAPPTFSVYVAGQRRSLASITAAVASVARQTSRPRDIVCLVDTAAIASVRAALAGPADTAQVTIVALEGNDAAILNHTLSEMRGNHLIWVDADATLKPGALGEVAEVLSRFPDTDLAYSDSDSVPQGGTGIVRRNRPVYSPVRLRSQDYLGQFRVFRTAAVNAAGGFRSGATDAHELDLALRVPESSARVIHLAETLYVAPAAARIPSATEIAAAVRVVEDHLTTLGIEALVSALPNGTRRIGYPVQGNPLVSIIIPTRGGSGHARGRNQTFVVEAIRGIVERSSYPNVEFVVVADDQTPQAVIDELGVVAGERLKLVRWSSTFNFSAKMNRGAAYAEGQYLLLLNDDVDLITPDWIERLLGLAQQAGIGYVGALLYFDDETIQHGGHLYRDGQAGHIALGWPADRDDDLGSLSVDREVSGVTAACGMVAAELYWKVGGFSALFPGNYNDVDFSMKVRSLGESILWTPHARLYHFESKSRVATIAPSELSALQARWGSRLQIDPYWPI
jgi:GT2 family glycosyltransferase